MTDAFAFEPVTVSPGPEHIPFAQWVILELMGHRRLAGFLTEQEIAGQGFLCLNVPGEDPTSTVATATQFYNPKSVYCITPTTEQTARAVALASQPAPVQRWELPSAPTVTPQKLGAEGGFPSDEGPF